MTAPCVVVAIDGEAASGKTSLALALARIFGWAVLDTGLLYRKVGWGALPEDAGFAVRARAAARALAARMAGAPDYAQTLAGETALAGEDAARAGAQAGADAETRAALLQVQRDFAHRQGTAAGAVLIGRDIGTVICPHALAKIYVTAPLAVRAERRCKQQGGTLAAAQAALAGRDSRDSTRAVAPLAKAADAWSLDTGTLSLDTAVRTAHAWVCARLAAAGVVLRARAAL